MTFGNASDKIRELRKLPEGWNYGTGQPLSATAHLFALLALRILHTIGANRFDVLPSEDGGATIMASFKGELAEILVKKDGRYDLFLEAGDCQEYENLDFGALIGVLEDAGWQSPKSFGSRTHVFTVESTEDSPVRLLPTMGLAHRLSVRHALKPRGARFATISTLTTEGWAEPHQSFGAFQSQPFLRAHG